MYCFLGLGTGDLLNTKIDEPAALVLLFFVLLTAVLLIVEEFRARKRSLRAVCREWVTPKVTPASKSWGELANQISYRFRVAGQMDATCAWNPVGSKSMREVIMTMGQKLDLAVENAWAELPDDRAMEKAERLWAEEAAYKLAHEGEGR